MILDISLDSNPTVPQSSLPHKSQCSLSCQLKIISGNNPWPRMPPKQLLCKPRKIEIDWDKLVFSASETRLIQQQPQVPCHVIGLKRALTWQLTHPITMQSYSTWSFWPWSPACRPAASFVKLVFQEHLKPSSAAGLGMQNSVESWRMCTWARTGIKDSVR